MRGDQLGQDIGELDLLLGGGDGVALAGCVPVGQEDGEGVEVVVVDAGDVGVGDDDVGEVAEGLDAVGETDGEEGEGEVGGCEEGFG